MLSHVCAGYVDFERRLGRATRHYPYRIFQLIKDPFEAPSDVRRALAEEVLRLGDLGPIELGHTVLKLRRAYKQVFID